VFVGWGTSVFVAVSNVILNPTEQPAGFFLNISRHHDWVSQDDQKIMQVIEFQPFSDTNWAISPPARADLYKALKTNTTDINLVVQLHFNRQRSVQNVRAPVTLKKCSNKKCFLHFDSFNRLASKTWLSFRLTPEPPFLIYWTVKIQQLRLRLKTLCLVTIDSQLFHP